MKYYALYLNITLMKSLFKPDCTYLMTEFVSWPFIWNNKSNFNCFNYWNCLPKPKRTHVIVSVSFKSVKLDLDMSLHYWLYLKKPITAFFHIFSYYTHVMSTECGFRKWTFYGYVPFIGTPCRCLLILHSRQLA